jgi:hypothetical protein
MSTHESSCEMRLNSSAFSLSLSSSSSVTTTKNCVFFRIDQEAHLSRWIHGCSANAGVAAYIDSALSALEKETDRVIAALLPSAEYGFPCVSLTPLAEDKKKGIITAEPLSPSPSESPFWIFLVFLFCGYHYLVYYFFFAFKLLHEEEFWNRSVFCPSFLDGRN